MGQALHEVMGWPGPMTHRQFLTWQAWLRMQWNRPSREDYYLMRIALEVVRSRQGMGSYGTLDSFKIPFKERGAEERRARVGRATRRKARAQALARSKENLIAAFGGLSRMRVITVDRQGNVLSDQAPTKPLRRE